MLGLWLLRAKSRGVFWLGKKLFCTIIGFIFFGLSVFGNVFFVGQEKVLDDVEVIRAILVEVQEDHFYDLNENSSFVCGDYSRDMVNRLKKKGFRAEVVEVYLEEPEIKTCSSEELCTTFIDTKGHAIIRVWVEEQQSWLYIDPQKNILGGEEAVELLRKSEDNKELFFELLGER